jgi:SAM-dependent methyltransferase
MMLRPGLFLPPKYVEQDPAVLTQYDDRTSDGLCQKPSYDHAIRRCKELGLRSIADFGCGSAAKLLPLLGRFELTMVDLSSTVEPLRYLESHADVVDHDFDKPERVAMRWSPQAIFCMDVVEHLRDPTYLLDEIRFVLREYGRRAFISSPCRTHCPGIAKNGPPNNRSHVREWTCKEFGELLEDAGLLVLALTHHAERPEAEGKGTMLFEVVDA